MRKFLLSLLLFSIYLLPFPCAAQLLISGTIYDSSKLYAVSDVLVKNTAGNSVMSDSLGVYHILANEKDSIYFFYNNKPTLKFPVKKMENYNAFDISLNVKLKSKYKPLKEIRIFSQTYKERVEENRQTYASVFNYHKPGLVSTMNPNSPPGLDVGELIKLFQFRRNKQMKAFRERLIAEEEEKYIDYRFNTKLLKRITHLSDDSLRVFQLKYRPEYEWLMNADELTFYNYVLKSAEKFRLRGK